MIDLESGRTVAKKNRGRAASAQRHVAAWFVDWGILTFFRLVLWIQALDVAQLGALFTAYAMLFSCKVVDRVTGANLSVAQDNRPTQRADGGTLPASPNSVNSKS